MTIEQKMALEVLIAAWDNFKFHSQEDCDPTLAGLVGQVDEGVIKLLDIKGE